MKLFRAFPGVPCVLLLYCLGRISCLSNSRARIFSSVRGKQTRAWALRAQEVNYFLMGEAKGRSLFLRWVGDSIPYLILYD